MEFILIVILIMKHFQIFNMLRSKVGKKRVPVNIPQFISAVRLSLTGEVSIREAAQR